MSALWAFVKDREPALVAGLIQAVLAVAVAWGLDLSPEQIASLVALSAAVLAFLTRQAVTPVAKTVLHPVSDTTGRVVEDVEDLVQPVTDTATDTVGRLPLIRRILGRKP